MKFLIFIILTISFGAYARDFESSASAFTAQARAVSSVLLAAPFFISAAFFSFGSFEWGRRLVISGLLAVSAFYGWSTIESFIKGILGQ